MRQKVWVSGLGHPNAEQKNDGRASMADSSKAPYPCSLVTLASHGEVTEEMPDERQRSARYFREKAAEIGRCAKHVRSAPVRVELFTIAEGFERMAARADTRRASAFSQGEAEWAPTPPPHPAPGIGEQLCKSAT